MPASSDATTAALLNFKTTPKARLVKSRLNSEKFITNP